MSETLESKSARIQQLLEIFFNWVIVGRRQDGKPAVSTRNKLRVPAAGKKKEEDEEEAMNREGVDRETQGCEVRYNEKGYSGSIWRGGDAGGEDFVRALGDSLHSLPRSFFLCIILFWKIR